MTPNILQQNISKILGIDTLSLEEQSAFLSEVGDVIFQTSLVRLVSNLSDDAQRALEDYLDTNPEPEVLLSHLIEHYTDFSSILEEVVIEFKEDVHKVMGEKESDIEVVD